MQAAARTGDEGCVGGAELTGGLEVAELRDGGARRHVHGAGEERDVRGHGGVGAQDAGDAGVEGAHVGAQGIASDDGLDVVVGIAGGEGADDGELVVELGEPLEGGAEGDAGDASRDFAGGGAYLAGRVHLRIERLELGGAAVLEEEDNGLVAEGELVGLGVGLHGEPVGEGDAAQ